MYKFIIYKSKNGNSTLDSIRMIKWKVFNEITNDNL